MNGLGGGLHTGNLCWLSVWNLQRLWKETMVCKNFLHSPDIHSSFILWNEQKNICMGVGGLKGFFSSLSPHHLSTQNEDLLTTYVLLHNPYTNIHSSPSCFEVCEVNKKKMRETEKEHNPPKRTSQSYFFVSSLFCLSLFPSPPIILED